MPEISIGELRYRLVAVDRHGQWIATAVREEFSIVEGRMFEFGTTEVVVGRGASVNFQGLTLGNTIVSGQNRFQVVGVFETDGSIAETEPYPTGKKMKYLTIATLLAAHEQRRALPARLRLRR